MFFSQWVAFVFISAMRHLSLLSVWIAQPSVAVSQGPPSNKTSSQEMNYRSRTWRKQNATLSSQETCDQKLSPVQARNANSSFHPFEVLLKRTQPYKTRIDDLRPFEVCAMLNISRRDAECPRFFSSFKLWMIVGIFKADVTRAWNASVDEMDTEHSDALVYNVRHIVDSTGGGWNGWCSLLSPCKLYGILARLEAKKMHEVKISFSGFLRGNASEVSDIYFVVREVPYEKETISVEEASKSGKRFRLTGRDEDKFLLMKQTIHRVDGEPFPTCINPKFTSVPNSAQVDQFTIFHSKKQGPACEECMVKMMPGKRNV